MSEDRTYWHVPYARSWHALWPEAERLGRDRVVFLPSVLRAQCGRTDAVNEGSVQSTETADRVPPNGHLCGSCARVIAARTDIEMRGIPPWPDNPVQVAGGIAVSSEDGGGDYGNTLP